MEVDIIQNNGKSTALVASSTPCTLDRKSVHQESQSRQGPMLSALKMPYECSTKQTSRDSDLFFNLAADDLLIVRRNESAATPSELSALAKWKKAKKKNQRPRNTGRQHSNLNVMNASAGRQPTRPIRHPRLQALLRSSPCLADDADDSTTAAQCSTRNRRRRVPRLIKTLRRDSVTDQGHQTDHDDDNRREHDDADVDERNLRQTVTFDDDELDKTCELSDPLDPEVPRAEQPQSGPHPCNLLSSGPPEQINQTVSFDEDELDKACEPSDPHDPEVPQSEPPQPGPHNLSVGPQGQINQTVSFDDDELDEAREPSDPLDPEVLRAEPPQSGPHTCNLPSSGPPEQINQTVSFDDDELDKEPSDPLDPEEPQAVSPQPGPDNLPEGPPEQIDAHEPPLTTTNAISTPDDGFIQARSLHNGANIATMYPPHQLGYSASTSCSALSSLRPSFHIGPPSISITNEYIDAQTTGETQPTGDKCTYTCRKMPQHTYDQLIRATATLLILWSQFWKWRRIKKKACYNYNR